MSQWKVPKPPQHLIEPYEAKKTAFTSALNKDILAQLEAVDKKKKDKEEVKENKYEDDGLTTKQRTAIVLKQKYQDIKIVANKMGLDKDTIYRHLQRAKKKGITPDNYKYNSEWTIFEEKS